MQCITKELTNRGIKGKETRRVTRVKKIHLHREIRNAWNEEEIDGWN